MTGPPGERPGAGTAVPFVRVVVAGGHSAGHIEPALSVADALRRLEPTAEVVALGTVRGLDTTVIPARGYPLELIPPVPLPRTVGRDLAELPSRLREAVRAAGEVLDRTRAEAVVGFGGYVAVPAYLAARRRRLPIVVHEANARPGVANRLAARLTPHVYTAGPAVRLAHATAVGIPLRPAIARLDRQGARGPARELFGLRADLPVLLVTGGSQGAEAINAAVSGAGEALRRAGVQVLHVIGPGRAVDVPRRTASDPPYVVVPYIDEMHLAYAAADFVLCRSGAMTCAELAAVGLPAAFVPLPMRGGEQRHNAGSAVRSGGAVLVDDSRIGPSWVQDELIPLLLDRDRVAAMSTRASATGSRDADVVLARRVLQIVAERRRLSRSRWSTASPSARRAS